jgi:hypothetical protein
MLFKRNKRNAESTTETTVVKPAPAAGAAEAPGKPKSRPALWKSVLVGGVPGILIGAMSRETAGKEPGTVHPGAEDPGADDVLAPEVSPVASPVETPAETPVETTVETAAGAEAATASTAVVNEAMSVSDEMTFKEAFAAARAEVGLEGAFVWHGQVYSTYRADDPEWKELSMEDRIAHSEHILSQVHATPYTPGEDEPEITEVPEIPAEDVAEEATPAEEAPAEEVPVEEDLELIDEDEDADVHIVGVELPGAEEGPDVQVAYGEMDGSDAVFADTDGDGEVDLVLIDVDGDGQPGLGEAFDVSDSGIKMDDLFTPDPDVL